MKRVLLIVSLVSAVSLLSASAVFAIAPNDVPRFALHIKNVTKLGAICTTQAPSTLDCAFEYTLTWPSFTGGYAYVVVGQAPSIGVEGASFGVDYTPGLHALGYVSWTQCGGGLTFPNDGGNGDFPQPGGGVRMTNYPCSANNTGPNGDQKVLGTIYMYSYGTDVMSLTENRNLASGPELQIADCGGLVTDVTFELAFDTSLIPLTLGRIGFAGAAGYTPCGVVLTKETTWGKMKTMYKN
jgi:hypothetical protein